MENTTPKPTETAEICTFCGLPIESWQKRSEVNGKPMHFDCYREKAGV